MTVRRPRWRRERGQAIVEVGLLLPVLLMCTLGVLDFGRALNAWVVMQNAAREGAFFAAKNPTDTADVQNVVLTEAAPLLTGAQVSNVVVQGPIKLTGNLVEVTDQVIVSYTYTLLTPIPGPGRSVRLVVAAAAPEGP